MVGKRDISCLIRSIQTTESGRIRPLNLVAFVHRIRQDPATS